MSDLVGRAIAAHGGAARFASARILRVRARLGGKILLSKLRSPLQRPYELEIDLHRPHARLTPFHRPGRTGIFDGDRVAIEEDGRELRAREGAREHARGHHVWDELDLAYFLGYAMWNYMLTPVYFRWPGFETRELEPWNGLERLEVTYPEGFPTHCRVQTFFFDEEARLTRLDYVAEVFGDAVRGAHLCEEHRDLGGVLIPTHRHVCAVGANLQPRRWLPRAMEGWVEEVAID